METNKVFEIKDVSFAYDEKPILRHLSFDIKQGKVTTIMGANGCGKSTLFQLMTKNLKPEEGGIYLKNHNIEELSLKAFAKQAAIVHQYNTAPSDLTVQKLVEYGRTPYMKMGHSYDPDLDSKMVERALKITGTYAFKDRSVSELSGGQKQRVWIAMALAQDTDIIFLDEPTTYLDVRYQLQLLKLVKGLNEKYNTTIIMVLHDINQALAYSDEIVALDPHGSLVAQGQPKDVISQETLKKMYKIDLEITDVGGKPFVIAV